jgi:TatD DNase family protein
MQLTDSHAHLDFEDFHEDFDAVLQRASAAGVEKIVNIGADLDRSRASVLLAENHSQIYATVGVHPDEADQVDFDTIHDDLMDLAKSSKKVVGIGETGLDYYTPSVVIPAKAGNQDSGALDPSSRAGMTKELKAKQKKLFEIHMEVAKHLGLPLVVHIRNGEDEEAVNTAYKILSKFKFQTSNSDKAGVIHCFTLGPAWAKRFVDIGFLIGFTGIITYKNAESIREAVQATSLDKLLLETDCPFLSPQKYRGERNEPAYVTEVASKIAEIKALPLDKVAEQTTMNVEKLFKLTSS